MYKFLDFKQAFERFILLNEHYYKKEKYQVKDNY